MLPVNSFFLVKNFAKELTLSQPALVLMCLPYRSYENTVRKGEIACNINFSFSHNVFYPYGEHFSQI